MLYITVFNNHELVLCLPSSITNKISINNRSWLWIEIVNTLLWVSLLLIWSNLLLLVSTRRCLCKQQSWFQLPLSIYLVCGVQLFSPQPFRSSCYPIFFEILKNSMEKIFAQNRSFYSKLRFDVSSERKFPEQLRTLIRHHEPYEISPRCFLLTKLYIFGNRVDSWEAPFTLGAPFTEPVKNETEISGDSTLYKPSQTDQWGHTGP